MIMKVNNSAFDVYEVGRVVSGEMERVMGSVMERQGMGSDHGSLTYPSHTINDSCKYRLRRSEAACSWPGTLEGRGATTRWRPGQCRTLKRQAKGFGVGVE